MQTGFSCSRVIASCLVASFAQYRKRNDVIFKKISDFLWDASNSDLYLFISVLHQSLTLSCQQMQTGIRLDKITMKKEKRPHTSSCVKRPLVCCYSLTFSYTVLADINFHFTQTVVFIEAVF